MGQNIVDIDDNLRIIGTAHVSTASVELVREQIEQWKPNLVAVELCDSRLRSLRQPDDLDNDDLLKIIKEGKSAMILLQSALAAQQRRMGMETGEKPGAELLAAIEIAEENGIDHALIDRDVVVTLRRAWRKMGLREKWRVLNALLWEDDDEEFDLDELIEDSDLLTTMMEEARDAAPRAGEVLIDERDAFLAGRIQQIRGKGKVLAVVGAGHINGIIEHLQKPPMETTSKLSELSTEPPKPVWPKVVTWAIPILLLSVIGYLFWNGDTEALKDTLWYWTAANAILAGIGVALARGHPLDISWSVSESNNEFESHFSCWLVRWIHPTKDSRPYWRRCNGVSGSTKLQFILSKSCGESTACNRTRKHGLSHRCMACGRCNRGHDYWVNGQPA